MGESFPVVSEEPLNVALLMNDNDAVLVSERKNRKRYYGYGFIKLIYFFVGYRNVRHVVGNDNSPGISRSFPLGAKRFL